MRDLYRVTNESKSSMNEFGNITENFYPASAEGFYPALKCGRKKD